MAIQTAIAFATLLLEDNHVFTFHEGSLHLANNLCALYGGGTYLHCTIGIDEENLVKLDGVTLLDIAGQVVDIQLLASLGTELLSLNLYNCVHYL